MLATASRHRPRPLRRPARGPPRPQASPPPPAPGAVTAATRTAACRSNLAEGVGRFDIAVDGTVL